MVVVCKGAVMCPLPGIVLCQARLSRSSRWGSSWVSPTHSVGHLFPSLSLGCLATSHLLPWSRPPGSFCCKLRRKSPAISVSGPWTGPYCWELQGMEILGAALHFAWESAPCPSSGNNVRTASLLSATISAQVPKEPRGSQHRWQSSRGNGFPGSIHWGKFNRDQGGLFQCVQCSVSAITLAPRLPRLFSSRARAHACGNNFVLDKAKRLRKWLTP
jgi:hypothetical protein